MEFNAIYQEKMPFRFIYLVAALLGLVALGLLGTVVYSLVITPVDNNPSFILVFLIEFVVIGGLALFILQLAVLNLLLTPEGVILKFGRIKKIIRWMDIESYTPVTTEQFFNSSGWRFNWGNSGLYETLTVFGKSRISIKLKTGRIKEVVFSTGNPEEVLQVFKKQTGKEVGSSATN